MSEDKQKSKRVEREIAVRHLPIGGAEQRIVRGVSLGLLTKGKPGAQAETAQPATGQALPSAMQAGTSGGRSRIPRQRSPPSGEKGDEKRPRTGPSPDSVESDSTPGSRTEESAGADTDAGEAMSDPGSLSPASTSYATFEPNAVRASSPTYAMAASAPPSPQPQHQVSATLSSNPANQEATPNAEDPAAPA
ncbi:hypothetical protein ACJJTC_010754, partial [Scirpophaga incertulas]